MGNCQNSLTLPCPCVIHSMSGFKNEMIHLARPFGNKLKFFFAALNAVYYPRVSSYAVKVQNLCEYTCLYCWQSWLISFSQHNATFVG